MDDGQIQPYLDDISVVRKSQYASHIFFCFISTRYPI